MRLRKLLIYLLLLACAVSLIFTVIYFVKVFHSEVAVPGSVDVEDIPYRIVVISQEMDSPFWNQVERGALTAGEQLQVGVEFWGTYRSNMEDFMKHIEIAIASKVDGIIVQGLNTEEFSSITKLKAAQYGIPVITIANDVSMIESLRKTYVGSNHLLGGQMIAAQLVHDMQGAGKVVVMVSDREEESQRLRLEGIIETFEKTPNIEYKIVSSGDSSEQITSATKQLLNEQPDTNAFIGVTLDSASVIVQEVEKRSRLANFYIYSFDDNLETLDYMRKGYIRATIKQSPIEIGTKSVELMVKWLRGEVLPLDSVGYYTDISVLRAEDLR
jgi:ribose transport system substrate-binding protein